MLRTRVATALVALPLLMWMILYAPTGAYNAVVLVFTFISLREFAAMALHGVQWGVTLTTAGGMIIALCMWLDSSGAAVSAGLVLCLIATLLATLATARDMVRSVGVAGQILLGVLYGGLLLPHLIWLRQLPAGQYLVFFVLACSMGSDIGGYFGGRTFGRHKLWPTVSPNKTIEGSMGAIGGSLVVALVLRSMLSPDADFLELALVGTTISVLAQLGDLLESMIKRAYDAKDSGWLIPGHGGVLDRTDSLVLPIVFIYYYALIGLA